MDLHLIPGLGADSRLFDRLELPGYAVHAHEWPQIDGHSTAQDYAELLAREIDSSRPHAVVGVSLGGLVAQEIAALTCSERVIIISSWKSRSEMPFSIRALRSMHTEELLTPLTLRTTLPIARWKMGLETQEDIALFDSFVARTPFKQLRAQIGAVLHWNGRSGPVPEVVHIHGDNDRLMPINLIVDPFVIPGGTHFMVYNKAKEVSAAVLAALARRNPA